MAFKLRNFTIGAFNRDANRSGDLRRKYARWAAYRARISALIDGAFAMTPDIDAALVTGAGNLNDIDLKFLCGKLRTLTLSDADTDAMEQGMDRQALTAGERGKITLLQADYTGANDAGFFAALEALAGRAAPAAEIVDYMKSAITAMASADRKVFLETYPLVISCPIYTQLLYTQIEVFLKLLYETGLYTYGELNEILNAAYGAIPALLRCYNDTIIGACRDGGLIVLLSDMIEMENSGAVHRNVTQMERDGLLDVQTAEALIKAHGSELSRIGRDDFSAKTERIREMYAVWPFDGEKDYLAYGCLSKKRVRKRPAP